MCSVASLTWSGLTGHWILFNVRAISICVISRLMDPPVRPFSKQNPVERRRNTNCVRSHKKNLNMVLVSSDKHSAHHLNTRFSQSPITATQMSLMPTEGRRWNHSGKKIKKVFLRSAAQDTQRNRLWASL